MRSKSTLGYQIRTYLFALTCALFITGDAGADSWPAAKIKGRASSGGSFVVRIVPGKSLGDVQGFGGAAIGPFARAEIHTFDRTTYTKLRDIPLLNPIAPVDIEVTNTGTLVTLDNWHNLGYGYVLAIYSASGKIVRKFTLLDLYSPVDLKKFNVTASSTHWRCGSYPAILESDKELLVDDSIGGRFSIKLDTGAFVYERNGGGCK